MISSGFVLRYLMAMEAKKKRKKRKINKRMSNSSSIFTMAKAGIGMPKVPKNNSIKANKHLQLSL
jgi:hypothetical protein